MSTRRLLLLAGLASVAVGGFATGTIRPQAPSAAPRPAYHIFEFKVTDRPGIRPYSERVASTFEPFGGRFIVHGGRIAPLEGEASKGAVVVIAFDSMEQAQAW